MLDNFNDIVRAAEREGSLIMVTHAGLFHLDDLACAVLLSMYFKGSDVKLDLIRTFNMSEIPDKDNVIVFDFGDGILGEGNSDKIIHSHNRKLSSLGKLWRFCRMEFQEKFEISGRSWYSIDKNLVAPIDLSDVKGTMNPLTYCINCIRNSTSEKDSWEVCFRHLSVLMKYVIESAKTMTMDTKELLSLPTLMINGKKFRFSDKWCAGVDYHAHGHIWKAEDGTYKVRLFGSNTELKKKNIKNGEDPNIIYISKSGRNGQVRTMKDFESII